MMNAYRPFFRYARGQGRQAAVGVFWALAQAALLVPIAFAVQGVFDQALPSGDVRGLAWRAGIIPLLFAANGGAALLNRHFSVRAVKASVAALRADLLEKAVHWSRERHARLDAAAAHTRLVQDTERVDVMANAFVSRIVPGTAVSLALCGVLLYQHAGLFLLLLVVLPLAVGVNRMVGRAVKRGARQFHADFAAYSKGALFVLQFAELVTLSSAEGKETDRQRRNVDALRASGTRSSLLYAAYAALQANVVVLVGAIVLFVGGLLVVRGSLTVGALLSFYVNLNLLNTYLREALGAVPSLIEGRESLEALRPLLEDDRRPGAGEAFSGVREGVAFEGVGFRYPDSSFALQGVDFSVRKNELFGIFGASGTGKTTLIRLLAGMHAPEQGRVLVDGTPVGAFDGASYRRKIGVLPQHPLLFPGTIRENLTYGLDGVDDARLREVCRLCRIDEHVARLEKGYDTEVGEFGVKLSGGQKQRLALARALLRDPDLLILDEPDNNLGVELAAELVRDVRARPMTVILITHNERLMALVDRHYRLV